MAKDLFGKTIGGGAAPEFKLNLHQKRQATLLYHWMSLEYLKGLKDLIDALIKGVDVNLELAKRQGRDALIANDRWGVRDTSANWSTHVFPALEDFRKSTARLIAWRSAESYCGTGANQCGRMISEHSSLWMTPEEEEAFKKQFEAVYNYAQFIDFAAGVGGRRHQLHDVSMAIYWQEFGHLFPRLPKFRVRTDVEGITGKKPLRTGVYVAQDDAIATLQFAWTGNNDGVLGEAQTLNDVGRRALSAVGRGRMWLKTDEVAEYVAAAFKRGEVSDLDGFPPGSERDPDFAGMIFGINVRTTRLCKWYFVERVEGEFDDETEAANTPLSSPALTGLRVAAGQACPRAGWWVSPAGATSRRQFAAGEVMPDLGGAYGATIWQWDDRQG
jgi:hypothetical protein